MEHKIKGCNALIHKILDQMLEYGRSTHGTSGAGVCDVSPFKTGNAPATMIRLASYLLPRFIRVRVEGMSSDRWKIADMITRERKTTLPTR